MSGMTTVFYCEFGLEACTESLLTFGWSRPEAGIVWSAGNRSSVSLPVVCPQQFDLYIGVEPYVRAGRAASLYIVVNSVNCGRFDLREGQQELKISVCSRFLPMAQGVVIDLFHLNPSSPAEHGGSDDRLINIALRYMTVHAEHAETCELVAEELSFFKFSPYLVRQMHARYISELQRKNRINDDHESPWALTRGVQFFMYGYGGNNHDRRGLLRRIWERSGQSQDDSALVTQWRLTRPLVERICPNFAKFIMSERDLSGVSVTHTLPERENKLYDPHFSDPWRKHIPPAFERRLHPAQAILKYNRADLLVNDRQYMIFDYDSHEYFPGCNPAGLSQLSIPAVIHETDRPVVVLQDQFDCSNVAHFLFDSCLRAYQYCVFQPADRSRALFILGGRPTEFHSIAVRALAGIFGLTADQFIFPRDTIRLRSSNAVCWFSDQVVVSHPAQGCRPEAVEALQHIAKSILSDINIPQNIPRKLYIARADAGLRRLHNEQDVVDFLGSIGFTKVIMSEHTWSEQISMLASADTIVAPHGMGLTLLAFNLLRPKVIEMFNPLLGSEAYALLSRAYGNDYVRLIGNEVDPNKRDFSIDIDTLKSVVA